MSPAGPAVAGGLVAVLEKRGRFLVALPLFGSAHDDGAGERAGRSGPLVVDGRGVGAAAGRHPAAGDLVLVGRPLPGRGSPAGRGRKGGSGHARVVRILGRPDVARDVIEGLMLDRGLRRGFDPAVEREARGARERAAARLGGTSAGDGAGAGARRLDLRELPTFTIDPVDARDFDDALSAEQLADGRIRVWVHIADVSAHVEEGSLVDQEAQRRGTSVYVPGAVEPMLPESLSNDACSLVPGRERLAVTVELELDGATITRSAFHRSLIRSDERLDYDRVDRVFAGAERAQEPWAAGLAIARRAAAALGEARARRGALVLDNPEPEFGFDGDGHVTSVRGRVQSESHRLVEHLMIAANEAVARLLAERSVPCLYRVHERPEPERVRRLADQLVSLGVPIGPVPDLLSPSQASELVGRISRRVDEHVRRAGGRGRIALTSLVLRSLEQARYSPRNVGHAGLHSACYCHFTSPIRRYPDLVCHRALLSAVGGGERQPPAASLPGLGEWTSDRERAAMTIERDADDVARCFALERLLYEQGWELRFAGEVTGLIGGGAFVAFGDDAGAGAGALTPYEGLLPVRRLAALPGSDERDWWELNELGTILSGSRTGLTLRLGQAIAVRVARVQAARGRVDLEAAS